MPNYIFLKYLDDDILSYIFFKKILKWWYIKLIWANIG